MLPLNVLTPTPVVSAFKPPWDEPYTPLSEASLGGIAIGDPSQGREVQRWTIFYESDTVYIAPADGVPVFSQARPGVFAVSLAFDANMAIAYAWQEENQAGLYFFESVAGDYDTITIPDASSCRVGIDDPRDFNSAASDVIFSYTIDGVLYYRQQRDRYLTQYTAGACGNLQLRRTGPSVNGRFQFLLGQ